jgi:putative transposase
MATGDGNLGALANVYPDTSEQRYWNHKIVNVMDKLPRNAQPQARRKLTDIAYAESRREAEDKRDVFLVLLR